MSKLIGIFLPLLILAGGLAAGYWFLANPDTVEKRPKPEAQALLVETAAAESGNYKAAIEAMGQVRPALEAALKPRVSGEIIGVAPEFVPGGHFAKDEKILQIDRADYELAVAKQEAILRQAEADYSLEMGRQNVARDELALLARSTGRVLEDPALALRKPQLEQAAAELEKAKADLERARLDLQRTAVSAPFNALVTQRQASLGDKVTPSDTLAMLVSTDEYWVEISVPVGDLPWLEIPKEAGEAGSRARVILDGGRGEREGYLYRLIGELDEASRLARLLVAVPDPLLLAGGAESADGAPLILSDYVKVVLAGRKLEDTVRIQLSWLRDGGTVWLNEDGRLAFRPVTVLYEDRDYAYIGGGLAAGDMIVTSDIAVPVEGMKLRTMDEARSAVQEKMKGPKGPNGGGESAGSAP